MAHGIDERPVVTESEPKSISRETTLDRDLHAKIDRPALSAIFTSLCERVASDLERKGLRGPHHRHQGALRGFLDGDTRSDGAGNGERCNADSQGGGECLKRVTLGKRIRLLGFGRVYCRQQKKEPAGQEQGQFVW